MSDEDDWTPSAEWWTTRPLEREYVTQEGDEIQLRVDGLAIWRGGRVVARSSQGECTFPYATADTV